MNTATTFHKGYYVRLVNSKANSNRYGIAIVIDSPDTSFLIDYESLSPAWRAKVDLAITCHKPTEVLYESQDN